MEEACWPGDGRIVIGTYYDAFNDTCLGPNDNIAGCEILLNSIEKFKSTKLQIEFVFFDNKEANLIRSKEYIEYVGANTIKCMINLDMCGTGNDIMIYCNDHKKVFKLFPFYNILKDAPDALSKIPGGDHINFIDKKIPTLFIFNVEYDVVENFYANGRGYCSSTQINKKEGIEAILQHHFCDTIDGYDEYGKKIIYNYLLNLISNGFNYNITNSLKMKIYKDACDNIMKDATTNGFGFGLKKQYKISYFEEKYELTKADAVKLIEKLIEEERLEKVGDDQYNPIIKCSICGKISNKIWFDKRHFERNFGADSKYKGHKLEMNFCSNCFDSIIDYLVSKTKKNCMKNYTHVRNNILPPDKDPYDYATEEDLREASLSDDEIDTIIPF